MSSFLKAKGGCSQMNSGIKWSTIIGSVWLLMLAGIVLYALDSNRSFKVSFSSLQMFTFSFETTDSPVSGGKALSPHSKGQ
jgi:hypothetical protein